MFLPYCRPLGSYISLCILFSCILFWVYHISQIFNFYITGFLCFSSVLTLSVFHEKTLSLLMLSCFSLVWPETLPPHSLRLHYAIFAHHVITHRADWSKNNCVRWYVVTPKNTAIFNFTYTWSLLMSVSFCLSLEDFWLKWCKYLSRTKIWIFVRVLYSLVRLEAGKSSWK